MGSQLFRITQHSVCEPVPKGARRGPSIFLVVNTSAGLIFSLNKPNFIRKSMHQRDNKDKLDSQSQF